MPEDLVGGRDEFLAETFLGQEAQRLVLALRAQDALRLVVGLRQRLGFLGQELDRIALGQFLGLLRGHLRLAHQRPNGVLGADIDRQCAFQLVDVAGEFSNLARELGAVALFQRAVAQPIQYLRRELLAVVDAGRHRLAGVQHALGVGRLDAAPQVLADDRAGLGHGLRALGIEKRPCQKLRIGPGARLERVDRRAHHLVVQVRNVFLIKRIRFIEHFCGRF